jgi:flavorubredoxin
LIKEQLAEMKFALIDGHVNIQYVPDEKGLAACFDYGRKVGQAVKG